MNMAKTDKQTTKPHIIFSWVPVKWNPKARELVARLSTLGFYSWLGGITYPLVVTEVGSFTPALALGKEGSKGCVLSLSAGTLLQHHGTWWGILLPSQVVASPHSDMDIDCRPSFLNKAVREKEQKYGTQRKRHSSRPPWKLPALLHCGGQLFVCSCLRDMTWGVETGIVISSIIIWCDCIGASHKGIGLKIAGKNDADGLEIHRYG